MYQQNLHISETDCVEFKYFISMNSDGTRIFFKKRVKLKKLF